MSVSGSASATGLPDWFWNMGIWRNKRFSRFIIVISNAVVLAGCGSLPNGRGWGQDAAIFPGWQRVGKAALNATLATATWAPAAAAVFLQINDMDGQISDWASDHTPIFGSEQNANNASDLLRDLAQADYLITTLATPSGKHPGDWTFAKLKGFAVGYAALQSTRNVTFFLKDQTKRTRPDESRDTSLPSNHAAKAAAYSMLAHKNIDSLQISKELKIALRIVTFGLDLATAWGRVEAKAHYPSDVLAGMALGHFMGAFFNDAFLGLDQTEQIGLAIQPARKSVSITFNWAF